MIVQDIVRINVIHLIEGRRRDERWALKKTKDKTQATQMKKLVHFRGMVEVRFVFTKAKSQKLVNIHFDNFYSNIKFN